MNITTYFDRSYPFFYAQVTYGIGRCLVINHDRKKLAEIFGSRHPLAPTHRM